MPSGAVIGALRVVIGADSAALDKGMKDAQNSLASFARQMSSIAAGVGLERIVEKAANFISHSIKEALTYADELGKAAQKVGMPVEELSKLKYAADLADVSFETLRKSLVKFDKNLTAAGAGAVNDLTAALDAMGIKIRDNEGNLKTQTKLIEEIADKFEDYEDSANKTALAVLAFGKAGAELIPLLNQGSKGIRDAAAEAERFGLVVNDKMSKSSEGFNDNMKRLSAVVTGVLNKMVGESGLAEALNQVSQGMIEAANQSDGMNTAFSAIVTGVKFVIQEITVLSVRIGRLAEEWAAFKRLMKAEFFTPEFTAAWENMKTQIRTTEYQVNEVRAAFSNVVVPIGTTGDAFAEMGDKAGKSAAPVAKAADAAKSAFASFVEAQQKANEARKAEIESWGQTAGAVEQTKIQYLGAQAALASGTPLTAAMQAELDKLKTTAGGTADQLARLKVTDEVQTSWEKYQATLEKNRLLFEGHPAQAETWARADAKAAKDAGISWDKVEGALGDTAGSLSRLTAVWGKENKAMAVASKVFGIAQAIINTQVAITKTMAELGMPWALPFIAAAVASGAASVAAITAQGFAQGGSFMVPGGASSTDNRVATLNLAAGERVDVTSAHETGAGSTTVNVDMSDGQPFYSRGNVEKMLNAMHTVLADGHRVQLVVLK